MTFTSVRYKTYREYLDSDLDFEGNFRLLSSGEVIELPPEDKENDFVASELTEYLKRLLNDRRLVSTTTEIQVQPIGDNRVNRRPNLTVLRPEHLSLMNELKKNAILFEMPAPLFVAELVSPGNESSESYRRDYEWKRQQYEWWQIPEYCIIDRHRQQVIMFTLQSGTYQAHRYIQSDTLKSSIFPTLQLSATQLLSSNLF